LFLNKRQTRVIYTFPLVHYYSFLWPLYNQQPMTHTLFLGNLSDSLKKGPMKRLLHALCAPYGPILDITIPRSPDHLRGTAFVSYSEERAVLEAVEGLKGLVVLGRQVRAERAGAESRAYKEYRLCAFGEDGAGGVVSGEGLMARVSEAKINTLEDMEDMEVD
jgi:hypothetical protein